MTVFAFVPRITADHDWIVGYRMVKAVPFSVWQGHELTLMPCRRRIGRGLTQGSERVVTMRPVFSHSGVIDSHQGSNYSL